MSSKVSGLASGFDTQGIIDSFMAIEKIPYTKLDVKKQTEEVKLQAYQAVNTYFLKFRTAVNSLSSRKLWNANACVSTNEKSLTATANEYADKGSYSFRVAQLATAAKFTSRGFSSSKTPLVKQAEGEAAYSLGSITMASAKTRVDNSAKLDTLNGGKGIFRGSVRITDAANNTSIIDLSACDTMDDVVRELNASKEAQISAYVDKDGRLNIEDLSRGTGDIRIQNVGTGTTATDLGIIGSSDRSLDPDGKCRVIGENAYILGTDMKLSQLNDGLGVETGKISFTATDSSGNSRFFDIDTSSCETVGDLVNTVNSYFDKQRQVDEENGNPNVLDGLRFTYNEEKTGFALTGTKAHMSYSFTDQTGKQGKGEPAKQLGIAGRFTTGSTAEDISFGRVLGGVNSPMLKTLGGATNAGVGTYTESEGGMVRLPATKNTLVSTLNGGKGLDISRPLQIRLTEANGKETMIQQVINPNDLEAFIAAGPGGDRTVEEVLNFMNTKLADYAKDNNIAGLKGVKFEFNDQYGAVGIIGAQAGYTYEFIGSAAAGLGLNRISDYGTEISLNPDFADEKAVMDKLDAFYNKSGPSLMNVNTDIKDDTTMSALLGLAGHKVEDFTDDPDMTVPGAQTAREKWVAACEADLPGKLTALFDSGGSFTLETTKDDGTPLTVTVNWNDVKTKLGSAVDGDTNVKDFMNAVNGAISDACGTDVAAPQLEINKLGTGFAWSNVDFSRDWKMSGTGMTELNLAKDTAVEFGLNGNGTRELIMGEDVVAGSLDSQVPGYYYSVPMNDSTLLSQVNYMAGFNIPADESFTIQLNENDTITIDTNDIIAGLQGLTDPSLATMGDYKNILNAIVQDKLNGTGGINTDGRSDLVDFEFVVNGDGLAITGVENASMVKIAGDTTNNNYPLGTGTLGIRAVETIDTGDPSKVHQVSYLTAADYNTQAIAGLGTIALTVGDNATKIYLNTDGLSSTSTLNELLDKLNKEAALHSELDGVRFTLNSAGTGIAVDNSSKKYITFHQGEDASGNPDNNLLARDLGLVSLDGKPRRVEAQSFDNLGSLNRNIISRGTKLADYIGANATKGGLALTDSTGKTTNISLENCETVGDLIDAINLARDNGLGIHAELNERGDGLMLREAWGDGIPVPPADKRTGTIKVEDIEGGSVGKKMGIAGTGKRDAKGEPAYIDGSTSRTIDVKSDDTLESLMYRIAESGNYKCAVVNSGTSSNPSYRLTITAANTGEESDFVISSDVDMLGLNQVSRGRDAKVLYGDPDSGSSPMLLSSATNSNSTAISGLTLDIKSASTEWTTITVDTDKDKVVEEIKNMVTAYNDLIGLVTQLDGLDQETGEKGILFGDTAVRSLLDSINDHFYQVFNPDNLSMGEKVNGEQGMWTWMDMGISLSSRNSSSDGSGSWFTTMELDEDALTEMVSSKWDTLKSMMSLENNACNINQSEHSRPIAGFNGKLAEDCDVTNAINGNINKAGFGSSNGIIADETIKDGANTYTIQFQKDVTISRMSIYHESSSTALQDFIVEYMDPKTGEWKELRNIEGNKTDQNHLGFAEPVTASAVRIKASSTNAKDDKFRLLDVQVIEQAGLAGQLNQTVNALGDTQTGFLASRNEEIQSSLADIKEQMDRLQGRLDAKEESLWRKFTAMETALGQLQNQGNYFSTMMGSMGSSK